MTNLAKIYFALFVGNWKLTFCTLLFAIFLFASFLTTKAETLHVYSTEIPWKSGTVKVEVGKTYSINEAISKAKEGDEIIIHEGIFREKVVVNRSKLTLRNNGVDYVLISGAERVSGWKDASGMHPGVKVADVSGLPIETEYTQLFANGESQIMARHPNNTIGKMMEVVEAKSGYTPLSNVYKDAGAYADGHATLEGSPLPNVDLKGGIFRGMTGKMRHYVYGIIKGSSANSVSFKGVNGEVWKDEAAIPNTQHKYSWGFVMHKNLIDYPGEWYLDQKKIYYLPHAGERMDQSRIEIQVREKVLVMNNTSGVRLEGLHFVAGNVDMQNTSDAQIEACSMRYLAPFWIPAGYGHGDTDPKGICLTSGSNNLFKDLYISHSWGNMFSMESCKETSFQNCFFEDFGWVGIFTSAIHLTKCNDTKINHCTFGDAGRFHIRIDGVDNQVEITDCDFYGAMKMGEDAGSIEATSTGSRAALNLKGSVIAYNKIHDVKGIPVSDGGYNRNKATALYLEDTENYTVHHNLIYNIKAEGYKKEYNVDKVGEFIYMGPRTKAMYKPIHLYNNTIWNVDQCISLWNIEIHNWRQLGIVPPDTTGLMKNGHFANNIVMKGVHNHLNYARRDMSRGAQNKGWVILNPDPSLNTDDFEKFFSYCATKGYQFNPQTNTLIYLHEAGANFVDAANGDFTLLNSSAATATGSVIEGITSSAKPDCGALEGGNRVLNAGAKLKIPVFKEVPELRTALNQFK